MPFAEPPSSPVYLAPFTYSPFLQAAINFAAAAENAAIAAAGGKTTRIHGLLLIPAASVVLTIKSGSTALTGAITLTAPLILPLSGYPYWTTGVNEIFVLSTGAIQISGTVWYRQD